MKTTHPPSNFSPPSYDSLPKILLTLRALEELDRRNEESEGLTEPSPFPVGQSSPGTTVARFARRGGPDLRRLRGYSEADSVDDILKASRVSAASSRSRRSQSTAVTPSTNYGDGFDRHLVDNNIYPEGYACGGNRKTPEPANMDEIVQSLANPRASLSPSKVSQSTFKEFQRANSRVGSDRSVLGAIMPDIRGVNTSILGSGGLPFTNLDSMTAGCNVIPQPDLYDGSHLMSISKPIRDTLEHKIVPNYDLYSAVPNLFVEAKGCQRGFLVAKRQACLDGAVGARAMHALQNYGETAGPVYDGNAYSFSFIYYAGSGCLLLYAHHPVPMAAGKGPEYHMTQIDSWAMTGNVDSFRKGATAFRNLREMAKEYRERFIEAANSRAEGNIQGQAKGDVADSKDAVDVLESVEEADVA